MKRNAILLFAAISSLQACGRAAEQNQQAPVNNTGSASAGSPQEGLADNSAPSAEPGGAADPKSAEAAGQLVQSYGALMEQGRWSEANALWGERGLAANFQSQLAQYSDVHLEIGNPGEPEGAAGSIYVTIPVIIYGDARDGQPFRRSADVTLRRVNDVPGSTEIQRRWHIERIDWAA